MSPAPLVEEAHADPHLDQLQAVGKAFDALLLTLYRLTHRHNELKQHTEEVFKQLTNVTRQVPPQDRPHAMEVQQRLLDQQKELCLGLVHKPRVEEQLLNSMEVIKTLVSHQNVDENATRAIVEGVKGYKALLRSQDSLSQISSVNSCMLARGPDPSLEQDFTTNGTQGNLHCPFSKPRSSRSDNSLNGKMDGPKIQVDTCGHVDLDPIKAEQEERRSSTTPSAQPSANSSGQCPVSRCPIRFLDKHSPEEIAEYVERHKHEIPRSHAICVKRYQRDPQNMRQLDAKYGGLINMISGLSAKHQAFLPPRQPNGEANGDGEGEVEGPVEGRSPPSASTERVEKWAENVDPVTPGPNPEPNEDDNRESRFDRPLREVRVGESPSRPWGIPVPLTQQTPASVPFSGSASIPIPAVVNPTDPSMKSPEEIPAKPAGRCPFGHGAPKPEPALEADAEAEEEAEAGAGPESTPKLDSPWSNWGNGNQSSSPYDWTKDKDEKLAPGVTIGAAKAETTKPDFSSLPSHVTFNGPVFFGYSAEQTAALMQQLGRFGKS
ncbi:uncharacterized protein N7477_001437 [Penicillium maclennaniae]|uniref:uncharacterized protein n=1 Tax=Penicillium maclennaniae TaxID=1343394 RepID=UPI0025415FC8|nr:uncharacterized protein N7477_001437 [Penicillium maclennaniae]KAJ5681497.1 hypothetical protein N7477_001437 [Penicillium maclennaniae]